jgi:hypothetical protein
VIFEGVQDMRCFTAQADRNGFIEAANDVYQEGVELNSLRFGITEFAVGAQICQVLFLERFFYFEGICLSGKTGMAGDKTKHSDSDVLGFGGSEDFLNHFGIGGFPIRMKDAGVDSETDTVAVILTASGSVDSLIKVGCVEFVLADCLGAIDAPGNNCLVIGFDGKEVIDVAAFSKQHKECVRHVREEIDEHRGEVGNLVKGKRIEHFAHIETDFVQRTIGEFGDLPQHCVVINVDFDEGVVFAIDQSEVAIGAAIRAAIRDGNEFVIGTTANLGAEFSVEFVDERRCLTNHQNFFAFNDCPAGRTHLRRSESLVVNDLNLGRGEQAGYTPGLGVLGDFSPKQNQFRRKVFSGIQK